MSENLKALLITGCSDSKKWYSDLIGTIVPLSGDEGIEYRSLQPEGYINYVSKSDCVVVEGSPLSTAKFYERLYE